MKFTELGHEITGATRRSPASTQLYESPSYAACLLLSLWLHKNTFNGQVILFYALLYSVIRFAIEFLRDDPRGDLFGLTTLTGLSTSQIISLIVGAGALVLLVLRWRKAAGITKAHRFAAPNAA